MSPEKWPKRHSKRLMIRLRSVLGRSCSWLYRVGCISNLESNINGIIIAEFGVKKSFTVILIIMVKFLFVALYFGLRLFPKNAEKSPKFRKNPKFSLNKGS